MVKLSNGCETFRTVDGKPQTTKIHPLSECIESVQEMVYRSEERVEELEEELKKLRDQYDKDEEVAALKAQIADLQEQLSRGFSMSAEECEAVEKWRKKHMSEVHVGVETFGAIGGELTYTFVPTSIGVSGTVECTCGESFCFRELG